MNVNRKDLLIGFEDVIDLLSIKNPNHWDTGNIAPPYSLKPDGIYAKEAFRIPEFTVEIARLFRPWFPPGEYGNYADPVCALPCDVETFIEFLNGADLWDRVMLPDGRFVELWSEIGLPAERMTATQLQPLKSDGTKVSLKLP